jgi:hypothetical protein
MHFLLVLENTKIYIKTYIKIAPTCFGAKGAKDVELNFYRCIVHLDITKVFHSPKDALFISLRKH